jgi:hypothetical protein
LSDENIGYLVKDAVDKTKSGIFMQVILKMLAPTFVGLMPILVSFTNG